MKAITVRHPWAHAIVHMGENIENRSWSAAYRGPLLIHAASTLSAAEYGGFAEFVFARAKDHQVPSRAELCATLGGFIGVVDLVDVVERSTSPWFNGDAYGFVLRNARPIPFQRWKGQQIIFHVPDEELLKAPPK